ncbi:MAG TPA: TonB-dependent receptor [Polyangiaceae bacterium]|nr:TonB-dependent receptor [Polyangiaceae bacterium]
MRFARLPVLISLLLATFAPPGLAADAGTVTGRVVDKKTGHAIPFASVTIPLAKRGGLTDSEGQFTVAGVPPGTYEVKVQYLGYAPASNTAVIVSAGKVTTVNFQIEEVVVHEEKAVEVTAERKLVEAKQGTTVRSVSANEIRNLPVTTVGDVLQQQAGVSSDADQIHIRGGRSDETIFVVNGVSNRDLVTGQSTAGEINARSVSEVNVSTGAYDVKYGNALSGVVDIQLKEGTDKFQTGITTSGATYGGRAYQLVSSGPDKLWTPALRLFGVHLPGSVTSILDVSSSFSETRFSYLNHPGLSLLGTAFPTSGMPPGLHSTYEDSFFGIPFTYGPGWAPSEDNRWAGRYGIYWKPNDRDKISYSFSKRIAIDQGFSRTILTADGDLGDPAYPWQWSHRIDHASTFFEDNVQSTLQWRRTLSTTGFTEAQFSRYFFAQRQDVNGELWGQYVEPDDRGDFPAGDPRRDDYFYDSGDDYQWSDRRTTSYNLSWSINQRNHHNEYEAGVEHEFQTVQYADIEYPWVFDPSGLGQAHDLWVVHPWIGDFYVRDRLEYEGFVANVGMRADYWVIGREAEEALADTTRHNVPTSERTDFYNETSSFFGRRMKIHYAPRIIVAHPITETSSFFFNYGEFTQIPSYRYVYSKLNSISSESFPLQGNPNLNPEVSVNYEVGAKHQFMPTAAANLSFFVKDDYDYPSANLVTPLTGTNIQSYFVYLNGHFARSKGFEFELEKRPSHHWSGKLTYTYAQTKGKSSNPAEEAALQEIGGANVQPLTEEFVAWNRPHKLTANLDIRFEDSAPSGFGWLRHCGFNIFVQGESGRAYTPYDITDTNPIGLTDSRNAPFQMTTDIKFDRSFLIGTRRFDVSLQGNNVFSAYLINRVDPVTGKGYVWGQGEFDPAHVSGLNDYVRQGTVDDPSNYGPGAQWKLQLDVDL